MLAQAESRTRELRADGSWATDATTSYYNSDAQVSAVDAKPDGSAQTCTSTSYATPPAGNAMMEDYPDQVTTVTGAASGGACPAATSANIVTDARTYYDQAGATLTSEGTLGHLASPGGLATGTAAAVSWPSAGSESWQPQSAVSYDAYGRVTSSTDADGNTTTSPRSPRSSSRSPTPPAPPATPSAPATSSTPAKPSCAPCPEHKPQSQQALSLLGGQPSSPTRRA